MKLTKSKDKLKHSDQINWEIDGTDLIGTVEAYIVFNRIEKKVYVRRGLASAYQSGNKGDILIYPPYSTEYFTFCTTETGGWSIKNHPVCNLPTGIKQWRLLHNV